MRSNTLHAIVKLISEGKMQMPNGHYCAISWPGLMRKDPRRVFTARSKYRPKGDEGQPGWRRRMARAAT